MKGFMFLLAFALALLACSPPPSASGAVVEHTFNVQNRTLRLLCGKQVVPTVNGSVPGPIVRVQDGDTLVVHVVNNSPYNITIHWHGIFQMLSAWADGPNMITQCPIRPGGSYTYRFTVTGQEGTLWWHAHVSTLRATVYGALIIRPKSGNPYPFPKPDKEVPIILGEWWNANVVDVESQALATGAGPNNSDAYTINGFPGDLYPNTEIFKLTVEKGKTYLLRIINAALNNQLFFKIASHKFTVVAVDATYTTPYKTDVVLVAPGQTTDVLLEADQAIGSYYMAARPYASAPGVPFANTTTRGLITYKGSSTSTPQMPNLPAFNDTPTAFKFNSNITSDASARHWVPVPTDVDRHMFVTVGLGLEPCTTGNGTCQGPNGQKFAASMNNVSFQFPTTLSLLQAFSSKVGGVYTRDFPSTPLLKLDHTNPNINNDTQLLFTRKGTKVQKLKYNETVEMVLQNTAILTIENHPIHIHGFNFHVLAQGFGNYNKINGPKKFNLINPQIRNTIGVPVGGWAVVRFQANNPGIWFMHCHLDAHLPWGLAMAFEVENGPTPGTRLPPPPADLPKC
ncbi:LAC7 [Linum perenne]